MTSITKSKPINGNSPFFIALMLIVDSGHYIWGRMLADRLPPLTSAFYVLLVATIEVGLYMAIRREIDFSVLRKHALFFASIGLLIGVATLMSYTGVGYVDAGTASLLSRSGTVFGLLLGVLWLRERLSRLELVGALFCIVGGFTIVYQPADVLRLGSLIILGASFAYALHVAIVKRYGDEIEFVNFFLFRIASTTAFLWVFALAGGGLVRPDLEATLVLILVGSFDVVLSRVLYYWALRQMRLSVHTLILTLSPVVTVLWGLALFGELPTRQAIIGGLIVIAGILIISRGRTAES